MPAAADSSADGPAYDPANDPAYGPPGPDWYRREADETDTPTARPAPEAAGAGAVRSPFEPIRRSGHEPGPTGRVAGERPRSAHPESPDYASAGSESPDDRELDLSGLEGDALGQLRGLYAVAGSVQISGTDEQFRQLLERQRKLISEYFKESGGQRPAVPSSPGPSLSRGPGEGEALPGTRGERLLGR